MVVTLIMSRFKIAKPHEPKNWKNGFVISFVKSQENDPTTVAIELNFCRLKISQLVDRMIHNDILILDSSSIIVY